MSSDTYGSISTEDTEVKTISATYPLERLLFSVQKDTDTYLPQQAPRSRKQRWEKLSLPFESSILHKMSKRETRNIALNEDWLRCVFAT